MLYVNGYQEFDLRDISESMMDYNQDKTSTKINNIRIKL
jgi:hypothetical protein